MYGAIRPRSKRVVDAYESGKGFKNIFKTFEMNPPFGLTDSTEALTMAALEQASCTRSIEVGAYHSRQDSRAGCAKIPLRLVSV